MNGISATTFVKSKVPVQNILSQKVLATPKIVSTSKSVLYVPKNLSKNAYISKSLKSASTASTFRTSNSASIKNSKVVCYVCKRIGHKAFECNNSRNVLKNVRKIWVPKGTTSANLQGPKLAWVPKRTP